MDNDYIFKRMMDYIIEDNFEEARMSILSDISKIDNNPMGSMIIMSSKNIIELIKNTSGFSFMSENIKKYYSNPEKALIDYKK